MGGHCKDCTGGGGGGGRDGGIMRASGEAIVRIIARE